MSQACRQLHSFFNKLPRNRFPYDEALIPWNGIYLLFETGEISHGMDWVVRVGTHTRDGRLPSRLNEHFLTENKDRGIFRKNIGRALLAQAKDAFLQHWNEDLTSAATKARFSEIIDSAYQRKIERQVSEYIRENLSFVVIEVSDREARLLVESKIISTIAACDECTASTGWLGSHSPKRKIRSSGLWLEQG